MTVLPSHKLQAQPEAQVQWDMSNLSSEGTSDNSLMHESACKGPGLTLGLSF